MQTKGRCKRLRCASITILACLCFQSISAHAQGSRWDALLTNSNWYVPVPNLIAYASSTRSFTTPPPTAIGDQTLWALGTATHGVFTGQSTATFYNAGQSSTSSQAMQGVVTTSGQIAIGFFNSSWSLITLGIGQMREIAGVPLMEMQMITSPAAVITHWAYMTPYNPATFTPPSASQFTTANITSPEWRWTAGTTWQIRSQTLFGTTSPGTFKITDYSNGYYWGLGAPPLDSSAGNFTLLGSMTPEGNVVFSRLDDGVLTSLTGQITGEGASGAMVLRPYDTSGVFGPLSSAGVMPVSTIAAGQTYFISNVGTTVIPAFQGGTLQVDTNGQTYGQNFTVDGSPTNRLDQRGNSARLSGALSDAVPGMPGQLVVANSESGGRIVFTGASTYSGPTTIESGATLVVDGSLVSSVNVMGTLGGSGRVGTTTVGSGGILAPGSSIGTLAVQGNLSFAPGSIYAVEVAPGAIDRVTATGSASLKGTVLASFVPGGSYSPRGQSILSAAGGRSGAFDALVAPDLPAGFLASLSYTSTDVLLNLTAGLGVGTPLTANQSAVAAAINNGFNTGNSLPSGLAALFGQTGGALAGSLGALSGEVQTGVQVSAFAFGNQFLDTVLARGGGAGLSVGGNQYASLTASEPAAEPRRLRGWLAGFGGYGWLEGQANTGSSAVQASTQGLAAGGDWTFDEGLLGFAITGGSANWFLGNGLGTGRGNMFQVGLYGRTTLGPLYLAAAGAWGQFGVNTQRPVPYLADWLTASYTATTWSGRAEIGHRFAFGEHGVTPFVAGQGQVLDTPGFCETSQQGGGTALCFGGGSTSSLRSELGLEGDAELGNVFGARTRLVARLAWAHEYQTTGSAAAWFQSLPGSAFVVSGAPLPSDMGIVRVMSNFELDRTWSLRLQADAEFADRYGSIGGTVRIAGRF
ncbi:MAG: autotransporter domain-containing protein [Reyranella sp.]